MNDEIINCAPPKGALLIEMNSKSCKHSPMEKLMHHVSLLMVELTSNEKVGLIIGIKDF